VTDWARKSHILCGLQGKCLDAGNTLAAISDIRMILYRMSTI